MKQTAEAAAIAAPRARPGENRAAPKIVAAIRNGTSGVVYWNFGFVVVGQSESRFIATSADEASAMPGCEDEYEREWKEQEQEVDDVFARAHRAQNRERVVKRGFEDSARRAAVDAKRP